MNGPKFIHQPRKHGHFFTATGNSRTSKFTVLRETKICRACRLFSESVHQSYLLDTRATRACRRISRSFPRSFLRLDYPWAKMEIARSGVQQDQQQILKLTQCSLFKLICSPADTSALQVLKFLHTLVTSRVLGQIPVYLAKFTKK